MSTLSQWYPGNSGPDFLLAVTLGVGLVSSAAWLISWRLAGKAALRHLVLFSALICCLAFPAAAWFCYVTGLTLVSIPILREEHEENAFSPLALGEEGPGARGTDLPPVAPKPPLPHADMTIDPKPEMPIAPAADKVPAKPMPSAPVEPAADNPAPTFMSFRGIATGGMLVWAAGVLLMLARLARNCGRVMQLRRSSSETQSERLQALLQEVAARLGMRQIPLLLVSSRTFIPLAVGFGRPAVILPERLLGAISDDELTDILMHEAAHLQRGDQWTVLLQELAAALYWPIVSVHALNRELQRAREEVCDNVVLANRNAIGYSETLLHVAELSLEARPTGAAVGILGGQGELERRIAGLIDPRRNTMTKIGRKMACLVMFLFIGAGVIASATRFAASADAQQATPTPQAQKSGEDSDVAKSTGHFKGRVTGPDGKPVRGARVYVAAEGDGSDRVLAVRAITDADGRYAFDASDMTYTGLDGLPARRNCIVSAMADGYGVDWSGRWGWRRVNPADLALQLVKDDVPIRGRFLGTDGKPLAGARVRLTGLWVPLNRDLDAHLEREKKFGLVASPGHENGIALPSLSSLIPVTAETRTDADGRFTLSGFGRERLAALTVSAPSVIDTHVTVMTRDGPDVITRLIDDIPGPYSEVVRGAGFTLQLQPGRTISGVVRDRDTRAPIAGMWVGIGRDNPLAARTKDEIYPRDGVIYNQTVTDAKGRFTITGLDPKIAKRPITAASAPGMAYMSASVFVEDNAPALIECQRAIPFRLKLVDEQGRPVLAKVTYNDVSPNPHAPRGFCDPCNTPLSRAARHADGTYHGFVVPGPGAVLVETSGGRDYRPASVDPKAFFAPGRTEWTAQEMISTYGTKDTLVTSLGLHYQDEYAAIVLVNPRPNSKPLELSATVVKAKPRRVSLIDSDGKPVVGVQTKGMTSYAYASEPPLRAASFSLTTVHPERVRQITFWQEERRLIGFLEARGDGDAPYTVRMQPWAAVTGRLVNEAGKPLMATLQGASEMGWHASGIPTDANGRFRIDRLFPDQRSSALYYRGDIPGGFVGTAFEKLVLRPGEVRDLGDIRIKSPGKRPGN